MSQKEHNNLIEALENGYHTDTEALDGDIVDMVAHGYFHQIVGRNIFRILDKYVSQHNVGEVFYYGLMFVMQGFPDNTWLVPDISYIKTPTFSRPVNWQYEYPHLGVPDLAVEVVASDDKADYVRRKVWTWLEKGTREVWLVYPHQRELHQFTSIDRNLVHIYGENLPLKNTTTIDAEALFPGIEGLTTDALFNLPQWATKDSEESES